MGAGASSASATSGAAVVSKAAVSNRKKAKAKNDGDFNIICRVVFDEADRNKNGKLDNGEVRVASTADARARALSLLPPTPPPHSAMPVCASIVVH